MEAEIGQQGGSGANRMQELEQTIVRQYIYIYICIYVKIHCSKGTSLRKLSNLGESTFLKSNKEFYNLTSFAIWFYV